MFLIDFTELEYFSPSMAKYYLPGMNFNKLVKTKFNNLGMPLVEVIRSSTQNAAKILRRPSLGNLKIGLNRMVGKLKGLKMEKIGKVF